MDEASSSPLKGFTGGTQWCVDASFCDSALLRNLVHVESFCSHVIDQLDLNVVGQHQRHQFPSPGGVTLLYLLSESHLACHTYPEFAFATFNLYCCRPRPTWDWEQQIQKHFSASQVNVRVISREMAVNASEMAGASGDATGLPMGPLS